MQHPHLLHSTCTNPCGSLSSAPACAAFWALRNGGQVAQLVEHSIENAGVPGSTPGLPTINYAADGWRRQFPAWYALVLAKPSLVSAGEKPLRPMRPMRSIALYAPNALYRAGLHRGAVLTGITSARRAAAFHPLAPPWAHKPRNKEPCPEGAQTSATRVA